MTSLLNIALLYPSALPSLSCTLSLVRTHARPHPPKLGLISIMVAKWNNGASICPRTRPVSECSRLGHVQIPGQLRAHFVCVGSRNGIGEGRFRVPEINCLKFAKKERWQSECGSVNV